MKFKRDSDDPEFRLKTSAQDQQSRKPLIQELSSNAALPTEIKPDIASRQEQAPFSWCTATQVDLKPQFISQADYVFINLPLRGYNKETDIRYALSENELLLEVKDTSQGKFIVRRLCQTLHKQIDVSLSEVMLLVDFVSVKLCKLEKGHSWGALGYDIANFTIPERGQMKSNFLKTALPKEDPVAEKRTTAEPAQMVPSPLPAAPTEEQEPELTEEEREAQQTAQIEMMIARQAVGQQMHLNLDCGAIY